MMDDLEFVARYIAARKMGLVKDVYGHRLPVALWSQCETQAAELLKLHAKEDLLGVIDLLVQPR
jgi:hypothetical protein